MKILDNVKYACGTRGITLTELAERMGIARNTLYISLRADMRISTLQRVADAIGCDIADFFTDAGNTAPRQQTTADNTTHAPASASTSLICPHCGTVINVHITAEQQPAHDTTRHNTTA